MDVLDRDRARLADPAPRRTKTGARNGKQRHGVYELIRQDVV